MLNGTSHSTLNIQHSTFLVLPTAQLPELPTIMRESLVGLRHLVRVFSLLDGVAAVVGGIHDLAGKLVLHRLLAAAGRVADQPADGQGGAAGGAGPDGNLVVRTAHAAGL